MSRVDVAKYLVNQDAVSKAEELISSRLYVVRSEWSEVQPDAGAENRFLKRNGWDGYAAWHLGLTEGATEETKARYAFVFGDFRRLHRSGLMACRFRATQWDHKEIELAAHALIQVSATSAWWVVLAVEDAEALEIADGVENGTVYYSGPPELPASLSES